MLKAQATGQQVPEEFTALVRPHVDSYDYFIGDGMHIVVESLDPIEVSPVNTWKSCTIQSHAAMYCTN